MTAIFALFCFLAGVGCVLCGVRLWIYVRQRMWQRRSLRRIAEREPYYTDFQRDAVRAAFRLRGKP